MTVRLVPITQRQAKRFVADVHRHGARRLPRGAVFQVVLEDSTGTVVAVAMAGRPEAPALDDGRTIEITRVATKGARNACSMLYGACCRAAVALGYARAVTYTRQDEPGSSLRAAGFTRVAETKARSWAKERGTSEPRDLFGNREEPTPRVRWVRSFAAARRSAP